MINNLWKKYYIFVEKSGKSVYYFQRYRTLNYFPPIVVNEIKSFAFLLLDLSDFSTERFN